MLTPSVHGPSHVNSAFHAKVKPIAVTAYTTTTALGLGLAPLQTALHQRRSGLRPNDLYDTPLPCWIGRVAAIESTLLPRHFQRWDCRNNRLAWLTLQQDGFMTAVEQLLRRYPSERIAVIIGTSTASVAASEEAYRCLDFDIHGAHFKPQYLSPEVHSPHSLADFVQQVSRCQGPCVTLSTACSSSAKVFSHAARLMRANLVDAAIVGGVDTLCGSVIYGFHALQLVSPTQCRPFDRHRDGLSLGEAGGFAILEHEAAAVHAPFRLLGDGETSDAYHMSHPDPDGNGALQAMANALRRAGLEPEEIGYLNLHGTATAANDSTEAKAVSALFPPSLHASSTKAWTGHTLGAAGIVEVVISLLALRDQFLPGTLNCHDLDPLCGPQIQCQSAHRPIAYAMTNSFGFGGNNCSLLFGCSTQ